MATDLSSSTDELSQLLRRLADRERVRSEATVQADIRQLLLTGGLEINHADLSASHQEPSSPSAVTAAQRDASSLVSHSAHTCS